jgi:hypothetical protein
MPIVLLAVIGEALKLVNLILEGVPVEQRRAQAIAWFWLTWPILKQWLKLAGAPDDAAEQIEALMKGTKP